MPERIERSTYVLFSSFALMLILWQWRPIPSLVWNVTSPALSTAIFVIGALGWLTVLTSTFLINHFDLFGLRQVFVHLREPA